MFAGFGLSGQAISRTSRQRLTNVVANVNQHQANLVAVAIK
jgi:hypothetical protein